MGSHLRVLVVDDDADNADTTAVMLRLWGHEAKVARDGKSALLAAAEHAPDVVLFDLAMPGMTGFELAKQLKAAVRPKTPLLVAISGYSGVPMHNKVLAAGAHLLLVKPVPPDTLKELLDRLPHDDDSNSPS